MGFIVSQLKPSILVIDEMNLDYFEYVYMHKLKVLCGYGDYPPSKYSSK